jgi:hypothetical protein
MIDRVKLSRVSEIVTHAACPDGTGAAIICGAAFRAAGLKRPHVKFVQYGTPKHEDLDPKPGQMFVDITPPRRRWEEWKGLDPIVLDHHETAMHVVEGLGGVYGGDSGESGSMLAFKHVMMPFAGNMTKMDLDKWEEFALLCMVRDLWKTDHERWNDACAVAHALLTLPREKFLDVDINLGDSEFMTVGRAIYGKILIHAERVWTSSIVEDVFSTGSSSPLKVAFFNIDKDGMSDTAHVILNKGVDVAAGFFYLQNQGSMHCVVSLRSEGRVRVSDVARSFGGGGHPNAAGYRIADAENLSPRNVLDLLKGRLK